MAIEEYFSSTYEEARIKFLDATHSNGVHPFSYVLPGYTGPNGEVLSVDVAKIGADDAENVLILISGTHGVEGFTGSGCQVGFLSDALYEALPPKTCSILVHAVNPYGFAWLRRGNEQNIDLNRNFHDFPNTKLLPDSSAYSELHKWLIPDEWNGPSRESADLSLQQFIISKGLPAFQAALQGGQYDWPTGLFYGGRQATWSNKIFRQILVEHIPTSSKRVASIDIHTGLGPVGYGEPIFIGQQEEMYERAKRWFGPELTRPALVNSQPTDTNDKTSVSAVVFGTLSEAYMNLSPSIEVTPISLEFGTIPIMGVLSALRADHWLNAFPERETLLRDSIKQQILNAFYVNTKAWKASVYGRTADFIYRASRGLASN